MVEKRDLLAIIEIAAELKTDYQVIKKKVKKYKLKTGEKMVNGRLVKAVYLSPEEFEAIKHDFEYNRQKFSRQFALNERPLSGEQPAENSNIIELKPDIEQKKDFEIILSNVTKGYEIALEEKEKRIELLESIIKEKQADIEQLKSVHIMQNDRQKQAVNKQKNPVNWTGLLRKIKNSIKII